MEKKTLIRGITERNGDPNKIVGYHIGTNGPDTLFTLFSQGDYLLNMSNRAFDHSYVINDTYVLADRIMFVPRFN
jgi:hypothetical protein